MQSYADAIVSSFEDPEKILEQAVVDMNNDLIRIRQATAQVCIELVTFFFFFLIIFLSCSQLLLINHYNSAWFSLLIQFVKKGSYNA